jgi:MFS family permease
MNHPTATTRPAAAVTVAAVALGVDMFLYGAIVPLLPRLAAVQDSAAFSGALFATYAVALLAGTPLVGRWVDRAGPRPPLLAGLLGVAAATLLFAAATGVDGSAGMAMLLAARAAQGLAAAASWTAGLALVAAVYPFERRGAAMGMTLSAVGVGILIGPAVSGWLADGIGLRAPFVLIGALALGDAVARVFLVKRLDTQPARVPFRAVMRGPRVGTLVAFTAAGAAAVAVLEPVLPLHLDELGVGTAWIGTTFAGAALAGVLTSPIGGALADRIGASRVVATGAAVVAVGVFLAGRSTAALAITGVILAGAGAQLILAPTLVLIANLAEATRPPAYGVAYALYNIAYTTGLAVAPLAAGVGAQLVGVAWASAAGAVAAVALAVTTAARTDDPATPGNRSRPREGRKWAAPPSARSDERT